MNVSASIPVPSELVEAIAQRTAELLATGTSTQPVEVASGRVALTKAEAAEALGISVDHLERHVLPELRIVRSGRLRLIPVTELEGWVDRHAARALEGR